MADQNKSENQTNFGKGRAKGTFNPRSLETTWTTIRFNKFDVEQLMIIGETLNVNKSEAIRTAIRVYAAILSQQQKR
jgi:hypothetical protein